MLPRILIALSAGLLLTACESTSSNGAPTSAPTSAPAPAMGAMNDECPLSGEPVDGKTTVAYGDHTIGFCCAGCVNGWKNMPEDQKRAFVASVGK